METFERRWDERRGRGDRGPRTTADEARDSYYGVPAVHGPHWNWLIIVYFFLGGIAGAAYAIAALSHLVGPAEDRRIVRAGRYLSLAALIPSPVLLILDLGRPERFLHMLRVVKLRSPMSVGTWGLTIFGGFSAVSALVQAAEDGLLGGGRLGRTVRAWPARGIGAAGAVPALFVAGYTGVLLAATAVPLWAKNALLMGPLFLSSAVSTATSAIALALAWDRGTGEETRHRLERLERVAMLAELGLLVASRVRLGETARPVTEGRTGALLRYGTVGAGLLLPLALQLARPLGLIRSPRILTTLASLLVLAGGLILRYAAVVGGRAAADDPRATFAYARAERDEGPPAS
ncbi:MAG: Formate dehydrogenase O putative subunit [uncultured Thermomicrobiales bacterium]|uniref:Formate dehydrogenase O putative subunit n=1 Tax=uncultured Thermomicrobiales bacterium TaxID=1645740 RepID=A0A6J4U882_9BACT|nr:MAG: Formate dehydrogenase O putative subunit [uncultured Thermomicrobiales bacterium]